MSKKSCFFVLAAMLAISSSVAAESIIKVGPPIREEVKAESKAEENAEPVEKKEEEVSLLVYYNPSNKSENQKILGRTRVEWADALSCLRRFEAPFLDNIAEYSEGLRQRRDADHYKRLGSDAGDPWKRENPLWSRKRKYRYMTNLDLTRVDFARLVQMIGDFQKKYSDDEIEQYVPYLALCLCEGMSAGDVDYYVRRDLALGTAPDLARERLYREPKIFLVEI